MNEMENSDCLIIEYWNYVGKGKNLVNAKKDGEFNLVLLLKLSCYNSVHSGLPESITKG